VNLTPTSLQFRRHCRGWALLAVITLAGCAIMLLASVMQWANSNAAITAENAEMFTTAYAAESATEKVLATMSQQYQNYGFGLVGSNMSIYATTVPNASDNSYWTNYQFGSGTSNGTLLVTASVTNTTYTISSNSPYSAYAGLTFEGNTYQIIANAQNTNTMYKKICTVGQSVSFGVIPLFQFAIFYQNDMEIEPGAAMSINGPVHGNANIYVDPSGSVAFSNSVSAVNGIYTNQSPNDPRVGAQPTNPVVTFGGADVGGVAPLNLPVSTNTDAVGTNASQSGYGILELPQAGQTPSSATGSNLLYNQADMIIIISNNNTISVTSGAGVNNQATVITNWQFFMNTNGSFTDQRDNLIVNPVVINVSNLVLWSATNTVLNPVLSAARGEGSSVTAEGNVQSIYVADLRGTTSNSVTTSIGPNTVPVTTSSYPAGGTYLPPITSTNTTPTTLLGTVLPLLGTYLAPITSTNSTPTTTLTLPLTGTYVPPITSTNYTYTTNSFTHVVTSHVSGYTYNLITGYIYNLITGYNYNAYATNYLTNVIPISQPGIVLSNGAALPPQGLSVASPDPAYIIGNWNVKLTNSASAPSDAGSNATTYTLPSAIYADAITVLSSAWNPANSAAALSSRNATSDTVTAAFFTGNVASDPNGAYSGGVENFPRFLENWSGQTFWYNGSMVQMFNSQIATNEWPGTGTVYNPPTRDWAYDTNFSNPASQPPLTPKIIAVQRSQWALLSPRATTMTNISSY